MSHNVDLNQQNISLNPESQIIFQEEQLEIKNDVIEDVENNSAVDVTERGVNLLMAPNGSEFVVVQEVEVSSGDFVVGEHCLANNLQIIDANSIIIDENGQRILQICNSVDNVPTFAYGEIPSGIQFVTTEEIPNTEEELETFIQQPETENANEKVLQEEAERDSNVVDVNCFLNLPQTKGNGIEDNTENNNNLLEKINPENDLETETSVSNILATSEMEKTKSLPVTDLTNSVASESPAENAKDTETETLNKLPENQIENYSDTETIDELENEIRKMEKTMKSDDSKEITEEKDADQNEGSKDQIVREEDCTSHVNVINEDNQKEKEILASTETEDLPPEKPSLPRFLQVDAKLIQEALRSKPSSETGDPTNSINPVFKICKMARKADGTVECVPMNMRDLNLGDRQRVYSAMLEKFPEIVKRQAASVLTPYQLNKLDSKLPPGLKLRKRRRKKLLNNQGDVSSINADTLRKEVMERVVRTDMQRTSAGLEVKQDANSVEICLPSSNEPTSDSFTEQEITLQDKDQIIEEPLTQTSFISKIDESACDDIEMEEEVETSGTTPGLDFKPLKSAEVDLPANSSVDSLKESEFKSMCEALSVGSKSGNENGTPHIGNSVIIRKYVSLLRPQSKKTIIIPTPPHSCNKTHPINCSACKTEFESLFMFEEHCLFSHLLALPHLFAINPQFQCLLCKSEPKDQNSESNAENLSKVIHTLKDAREHFRQHCAAQSPQCEMCKRLVQRDHMYAAPQNNEEKMLRDQVGEETIDMSEVPDDSEPVANDSPILQSILKENIKVENNESIKVENDQLSNVNKITKPSEINRILRRFDKEHHHNQMLRIKGTSRKLYRCRYCDKEFRRRSIWKLHVLAHLGHHPILCPLCGMSFHRKYSLSLHMQVHLMSRPKENIIDDPEDTAKQKIPRVKKQIIKKKQESIEKVSTHETEADDVNDINEQSNESKDASSILSKLLHEKGPVLCEVCGRELKNKRQLLQHQYRVHNYPRKRPNNKNVTPTPCPDCGKICRGPSALKHHQRQVCGIKEVLCEICGKVYPAGGRALSNHKYQVHKWQGSELEKMAIEKRKLRQLSAEEETNSTNSGEQDDNSQNSDKVTIKGRPKIMQKLFKPEVCELCGFVAKYSTSMRSHLVNKHKFPKKRTRACNSEPVACTKCGTICKGPGALKLHEKRFCLQSHNLICPVCGKTCTSRKNLSRHKYNHKWWGTDKEKAWREKRRLLGIPIRKKRPRSEKDIICTDVAADDASYQLVMNLPVENTEEVETAPTEEITTEEGYLDATSLLQVIHAANQAAGLDSGVPQTVHFQLPANTTISGNVLTKANILEHPAVEEIVEETEVVQEQNIVADNSTSPKLVNIFPTYHVVLTDENGRPMYAYLPDPGNS